MLFHGRLAANESTAGEKKNRLRIILRSGVEPVFGDSGREQDCALFLLRSGHLSRCLDGTEDVFPQSSCNHGTKTALPTAQEKRKCVVVFLCDWINVPLDCHCHPPPGR